MVCGPGSDGWAAAGLAWRAGEATPGGFGEATPAGIGEATPSGIGEATLSGIGEATKDGAGMEAGPSTMAPATAGIAVISPAGSVAQTTARRSATDNG